MRLVKIMRLVCADGTRYEEHVTRLQHNAAVCGTVYSETRHTVHHL